MIIENNQMQAFFTDWRLGIYPDFGTSHIQGWYFQAPFSIFTITRPRWSKPR